MKLGLGTVQFGMEYGVSNKNGQTTPEEVERILEFAISNAIQVLDTAPAYGTSEEVLGSLLPSNHPFSFVTKTPKFNKMQINSADAQELERVFFRSLERLRQDRVYGLLVHRAQDLFSAGGFLLLEAVQGLKQRGLVEKVGVSVYNPEQLDSVLRTDAIDLVQLPLNVVNRRVITSGHLTKLKKKGIEVHARSVLLQGLLLMEPNELPSFFDELRGQWEEYFRLLRHESISGLQAALGFIAKQEEVDCMLVGVCLRAQLVEIIEALRSLPASTYQFPFFASLPGRFVDPTRWRLDSDERAMRAK